MKKLLILIPLFLLLLNACAQGGHKPDSLKWVYDYEDVLTDNQEKTIDSLISDFENRTTNEIVIVTVTDIGDSVSMKDYAVRLGNKWGVGKKNKDNGLMILFSSHMRQTFLATGKGTEKILKDDICKRIVDSTMIPYFKKQQYFEGLKAGLEECIKDWE